MAAISLNGIRLSREMVLACQVSSPGQTPLHQILADHRINMVNAGGHLLHHDLTFFCCLEPEVRTQKPLRNLLSDLIFPVCLVSLYPHREDARVPDLMLRLLADAGLTFYHLVSSNAVVSLVLPVGDVKTFIGRLEQAVDLPDTHTPYVQEVAMDISPILRKYPETRSTYVEERIKTYGLELMEDLGMRVLDLGKEGTGLPRTGQGDRFVFVSAVTNGCGGKMLTLVPQGNSAHERVDFIRFHGPHFGDRYRILQTALDCLAQDQVPLRCMGCTGASLALVFEKGLGAAAVNALEKGFERP